MLKHPFKVFPSVGYLNSQFQFIRIDDRCTQVTIEKDGTDIKKIYFAENSNAVVMNFNHHGVYVAKCYLDGGTHSQQIEIKNSLRFGTSELKSAYTFEDIPYSFFLMRDRMCIYDENGKLMITENNISPSEIIKISSKFILLKTTLKNENQQIDNYALFSLAEFRIVWELVNAYEEVTFIKPKGLLWVRNSVENCLYCYSLEEIESNTPKKKLRISIENRFGQLEVFQHIFVDTNEQVFIIKLQTAKFISVHKREGIAIDKLGNLYEVVDGYLHCRSLIFNYQNEFKFKLSFDFNLIQEYCIFAGRDLRLPDPITPIVQKLVEVYFPKEDDIRTFLHTNIPLSEQVEVTSTSHSLLLGEGGALLLKKESRKKVTSIAFRRDDVGAWSTSNSISSIERYLLTSIEHSEIGEFRRSSISCSIAYSNRDFTILQAESTILVILKGKIIKESSQWHKVTTLQNADGAYFLLVKEPSNTVKLFRFTDLDVPLLGNIVLLNEAFLTTHRVLWYEERKRNNFIDERQVSAYSLDLERHLELGELPTKNPYHFSFNETYCFINSQIVVNPRTGQRMEAVVGTIMTTSANLKKVISRRNNQIYLQIFDPEGGKFMVDEIDMKTTSYQEAYLSPAGRFLILQNDADKYVLVDIETGVETSFFSGKFLEFSKEGNVVYETDKTRAVKIIDPLTFQDITPENYHHYRFKSPNGWLYSQLSYRKRYYNRVLGNYTDVAEVTKLQNELDLSVFNVDETVKDQILKNREKYFKDNQNRLEQLEVSDYRKITSSIVIKKEVFVEIGIVGTDVVAEILCPEDLVYFNYAAFSYDNKYFGYVGKPSSNGLIHIVKLKLDLVNKTLLVEDDYVSRYPKYASWVCAFSRLGFFATYDSSPDTYILKVEEKLFEAKYTDKELRDKVVQNERTIQHSYRHWTKIKGKSFLCFSPSGAFTALSDQGYEPLTLGGYGHQESSALHIASTLQGIIFDSFLEHGSPIKDDLSKKLVFVAFSDDETKIMSMSKDGVVIVRNIDLAQLERKLISTTVTEASK